MEPSEWKKATSTTMPANEVLQKQIDWRLEEIETLEKWILAMSRKMEGLQARIDRVEVELLKNGFFSKERLPEPQLKAEKTSKVRDILPIYEDSERR